MKEEDIDEKKLQKMMSKCEFEKDDNGEPRKCAPKESYTAERFTLFNRLNTLELVDTKNKKQPQALDDEQRRQIENLAYSNAKVTFAQIRNELNFQDKLHIRFNLCSYAENNPEYNKKLECKVVEGKLHFEEKHNVRKVNIHTGEIESLEEKIKKLFLKRKESWNKAKNLYIYYSDIRKQLDISDDCRFEDLKGYTKSPTELGSEAKYIKQFEDDTFVELKGYHKIQKAIEGKCGTEKWEKIKKDTIVLDTIAEALTYCKSDKTRTDYLQKHNITDQKIIDAVLTMNMKQLATYSTEAFVNIIKYMESGVLFNLAKEKCGYGKTKYKKQTILEPYSGNFETNPVVTRVISQTRKVINAIIRKYNDIYPIDNIHIEVATELANSKKRKAQITQGQNRYKDEKALAKERCREKGLDPEEGQNLLMFRLADQQRQLCPYTGKHITFQTTGATNEVYIKDCEIDHIIPMSRSFNDSLNNKVLCAPEANQNKTNRIPFEWFEDQYGKDSIPWKDFENTVKKMYGIPYPKRKNLLRKSWTDDDKENFLNRNLNDTRYAARHIADYLRKYFDFSLSERDDIKDISRVKVRSGGITAFLRYMWGLHKDREENDLHHAIDALVVTCSTDGHVYLVSNLSKEIEIKGENWYKHFGKDKFKPWNNVREDMQEAAGKIFISRMPRHKVTTSAHENTIKSKNNEEIPENKRVIKVNKGYANIGEMVRADIFIDKDDKYYVVPIYTVDMFANKPLPDKYVPDGRILPYENWPKIDENNHKFKFSLFKDDLISITNKDFNDKKFYVSFFESTTTNINVNNIDGSDFSDKKNAKDPKTKKIGYRPKRKKEKCIMRKYSVDILGKYKEVAEENRQGNKYENKLKGIT